MDFAFSEDQDLLRHEVRKFLDEQSPLPEVRNAIASPDGYSKQLWKQLGELGFLGLLLPAEQGGAGLGWVDLVVLLEESGRGLLPSPLVSTVLAGATILDAGTADQQSKWLPGLAEGSLVGTFAFLESDGTQGAAGVRLVAEAAGDGFRLTGEKRYVPDIDRADLYVVAFRTGSGADDFALAVIERAAGGVSTGKADPFDATKQSGTLTFDGVEIAASNLLATGAAARTKIERACALGTLAVTAEAIGSMEGALDITVEFAKQRVQFGQPIGHYQGVKHPLADGYVDIECLKSLLYYAAWAAEAAPDELARAVSEAKLFASEAFPRLGVTGIQLHGAVGFTEEYDIQLYLKRSKWFRQEFGDEDHHADELARLGGW